MTSLPTLLAFATLLSTVTAQTCCNWNTAFYSCTGNGNLVAVFRSGSCSCSVACFQDVYTQVVPGVGREMRPAVTAPTTQWEYTRANDFSVGRCGFPWLPAPSLPTNSFPSVIRCSVSRAVVFGDPHFIGFDGKEFEFQGISGGYFNLISEQNHQVNALFDDRSHTDATFMVALGLQYRTAKLHVQVKTDEQDHAYLAVELNGRDLPVGAPWKIQADRGQLSIAQELIGGPGQLFNATMITFTTPLLWITIQMHPGAAHLDIQTMLGGQGTMHGVLGLTNNPDSTITGDEMDFLVSDIWAADFKHNLFVIGDEQSDLKRRRKRALVEA